MVITPPKRFRHKAVALCEPGYRTLQLTTEDGVERAVGGRQCAELLARHEDHTIYTSGSVTRMRHTTGARAWTADTWRGRATCMFLDGTKVRVRSLRGIFDGEPHPFAELLRAVEWMRGYGVTPSSVSQMGWALWRRTLTEAFDVWSDSRPSKAALFGGRQEITEPRTYQHMVQLDLQAAYPTCMASRPLALTLRTVAASTELDPHVAGLAEATVLVPPDMPFYPLPVRVGPDMVQWQAGAIHGTWPWCELWAAIELGCDAVIHHVWAPGREADLFGPWWSVVQEGRALGGAAGRLVKASTNATWGIFGMKGDQAAKVKWKDDTGEESYTVSLPNRRLPHVSTAHLAAEISGRVRSRLLVEALYGGLPRPVHIDTDGVIVRATADLPTDSGDVSAPGGGVDGAPQPGRARSGPYRGPSDAGRTVPGQWRRKTIMRKVDVRAPQVYRYLCDDGCGRTHDKWHYVASGVAPSAAPEVFDRIGHRGTRVGVHGLDYVLPPGHAQETGQVAAGIDEVKTVQSLVFGAPLGNVAL